MTLGNSYLIFYPRKNRFVDKTTTDFSNHVHYEDSASFLDWLKSHIGLILQLVGKQRPYSGTIIDIEDGLTSCSFRYRTPVFFHLYS